MNMNIEKIALAFFGLYALIIFSGGIVAVLSHNLVRALMGLIITLFGVAGLYLLMAAPFMAFMQLLIYMGAVVVLIFLAIMLARPGCRDEGSKSAPSRRYPFLALIAATAAFGMFSTILASYHLNSQALPDYINIAALGKALINEYVLPFELISIVLLVAMAGAVLLGFERRRDK